MELYVLVAILSCTLYTVFSYPHGAPGTYCNRDPQHGVLKKAGDNGYRIRIGGDPETYVPNEVYTVSLTSINPTAYLGFILTATKAAYDYEPAGTFELVDPGISRFTDLCPTAVTHTSDIPKMSISVIWTAPPAGTGCVSFKATVVQQKLVWFQDDGDLTKTLCEAVEGSVTENYQREIQDCCACGSAKYKVTFMGMWTRYTHPKDYPSGYQNHWSSLSGASHSKDYMVFEYGGYATEGVRRIAEWGSARVLESEMKDEGSNIRTVIKTRPLWPAVGNMSAVFSTDSDRHLLSALTMLGPSPDWCTGVSALDLCTENCGWAKYAELNTYPWDAGTDSGITYMATNSPTVPQEKIRPFTNSYPANDASPFFDPTGQPIKHVGKLVIERLDVKGDQCFIDPSAEEMEIKVKEDYNLQFTNSDGDNPPPSRGGGGGPMPPKEGMEKTMPPKEMDRPTMMPKKEMNIDPTMPPKDMEEKGPMMVKTRPPVMPDKKMPVDCMLSEWGPWSECTKTCGKHGKKVRQRMVKVRPKRGGQRCGKRKEKQKCNTHIRCPIDCKLGSWSYWSECSKTCGNDAVKMRTRPVLKMPKHGGAQCGETKEINRCTSLPRC
ncbi:spondin-1-like [Ptychodera flava]|uniref:spondin-1-like n=1 Tax=Ptychodera flava TaxID=63121 RepID=UPI003969D89B